jgi:fructokinase
MAGIVGLGEALIDFIPGPSSGDGNLNYRACPGGSVANLCVAASKLGAPCKFIGSVGDDFFGEFLRSTLRSHGVGADNVPVCASCGTALAFVSVRENGERGYSFGNLPGADKFLKYEEIDLDAIDDADVLHVSSNAPSGPVTFETQRRVLEYAAGLGKAVSYDVNYRENNHKSLEAAMRVLEMPLEYAAVVKVTEDELRLVAGRGGADGARALLENGSRTKVVLVTEGSRGASFYTAGGSGRVDAPRVRAVDTTGAGDAFLGGFLAFALKNGGLLDPDAELVRRAVAFASRAAALAVTRRGVMTSFPTLAEVNSEVN